MSEYRLPVTLFLMHVFFQPGWSPECRKMRDPAPPIAQKTGCPNPGAPKAAAVQHHPVGLSFEGISSPFIVPPALPCANSKMRSIVLCSRWLYVLLLASSLSVCAKCVCVLRLIRMLFVKGKMVPNFTFFSDTAVPTRKALPLTFFLTRT